MRRSRYFWLVAALFAVLETTVASFAQGTAAPKPPPKTKPAAPRAPQKAVPKPPAQPNSEPEILTNDSIVKMLAGGVDEEIVIAKINSSAAAFTMDADSLIRLTLSLIHI